MDVTAIAGDITKLKTDISKYDNSQCFAQTKQKRNIQVFQSKKAWFNEVVPPYLRSKTRGIVLYTSWTTAAWPPWCQQL